MAMYSANEGQIPERERVWETIRFVNCSLWCGERVGLGFQIPFFFFLNLNFLKMKNNFGSVQRRIQRSHPKMLG